MSAPAQTGTRLTKVRACRNSPLGSTHQALPAARRRQSDMEAHMMRALAGTALLLLAGTATAADNGIYIGGSIGQANVEVEDDIADFDGDDTGFKVIAGIRPLDFLGFELNYVDLGAPEEGGVEVDATGIDAFAVGFLPLPL